MTKSGNKPATALELLRTSLETDASPTLDADAPGAEQIVIPPACPGRALVSARLDRPSDKIVRRAADSYDEFLFTFSVQPMRPSAFEAVLEEIVFLLGEWHQYAVIESPFQPRQPTPPCLWYASSDDPVAKRRGKLIPGRTKRKARSVLIVMQLPRTAGLSQFLKAMMTERWMPNLPNEVQGVDFEAVRLEVLSSTLTGSRALGGEAPFKWDGMLFYPLSRLDRRP